MEMQTRRLKSRAAGWGIIGYMKKSRARKKAPIWHLTFGLGVALVATGWYWSGIHGFYAGGVQAAAALLGF